MLELLWEIHRLRATITRAQQIRSLLGSGGSGVAPSTVWSCFERELDSEPCLTDKSTLRQQAAIDRILSLRPAPKE
ncbi:MAG: hypothetical protein PW999_16100 [Paraburkholderia tropica]|nr:hypothetical protein [Paraburkholderia tropica]